MDREKVIEALNCRGYDDDLPCSVCAYYRPDEKPVAKCDYKQIYDDAIALLKKQDEKPMIENKRGWNCPSCGMKLIGKTASGYPCGLIDLPEDEPIHFCPMCGQAVKWE